MADNSKENLEKVKKYEKRLTSIMPVKFRFLAV